MKPFINTPALARFLLFTSLFIMQSLSISASATLLSPIFINEIHYDNIGGDLDEFIEIAAPAGTSLKDWSLIFYNGSNGLTYKSEHLNDDIIISDQANGFGFYSMLIPGIQNGNNDGVALINSRNELVQFISYEGTITALDGLASGATSEDINVFEPSDTLKGFSLQLAGTGQHYQDFSWQSAALNSAGKVNNAQNFTQRAVTPPVPINETSTVALFIFALPLLRMCRLCTKNKMPNNFINSRA